MESGDQIPSSMTRIAVSKFLDIMDRSSHYPHSASYKWLEEISETQLHFLSEHMPTTHYDFIKAYPRKQQFAMRAIYDLGRAPIANFSSFFLSPQGKTLLVTWVQPTFKGSVNSNRSAQPLMLSAAYSTFFYLSWMPHIVAMM